MPRSKRSQQTGKTVIEKRRAKQAKRDAVARQRQRADATRDTG